MNQQTDLSALKEKLNKLREYFSEYLSAAELASNLPTTHSPEEIHSALLLAGMQSRDKQGKYFLTDSGKSWGAYDSTTQESVWEKDVIGIIYPFLQISDAIKNGWLDYGMESMIEMLATYEADDKAKLSLWKDLNSIIDI
ncbi:hypothetical protein [Halomonas lysinitropha]|uniref:Uncharacterized protein n=1 Tax=Halomonas lysinitropha TaxID=2607506 RepID=A0A5K1I9A2_9GAMM|nr:hypothetical protein [Halomonas lysinitropha]VVZ96823.1 hypothetical protein HALO32_02930 [Halomonas lysinitropha]